VLSVAVVVSLPLVNWLLGRHYLTTSLQAEAVVYSSFASKLISANPDFWRYEQLRLEEFLADHPFPDHSETRRIVDLGGETVARSPGRVARPSMARTRNIYDSGKVVARFVIERSLRPLMTKTFEAGLLDLLIGSAIYVSMRLFPLRALSKTLRSLYEEKEHFAAIFESALTGLAILDSEGRILRANRAYHRLLHYEDEELIGRNYGDITYNEDAQKNMMLFQEMVEGGRPSFYMEKRYVLKGGGTLWADLAVYAVRDARGEFKCCFAMMVDISQRKELEQKLAHNAFHDALTNLPNRALFMDRLNLSFVRSGRQKGYDFAVMFFDLDRFKNVNDSLGHVLGDQMLIEVSRRLRKCRRPYDTVARLGATSSPYCLRK
jgi:PAS domain S-box-containing protein